MPIAGTNAGGLGFTRNDKNSKPRRPRADTLPSEKPAPTEPILQNVESLIDVSIKPLFSEMWERGHGDYAAFASDFLDVQLHDGQKRWLHTGAWADERLISAANRWGKTLGSAVKALHDCFYQTRPPEYAYLTNEYAFLNLSLTVEMAKIAWEYALKLSLTSKVFRKFIVESEIKTAPFPSMVIGTSKNQRTNAFRSEYWARSSAKKAYYILGQKFDRINYDECARDPNGKGILDEVLRMRVADRNGQIDMPSTAAGKNWFYLECMEALKDIEHVEMFYTTGSAYENPHINHAKVKRNERKMVKAWVEQNIFGGFADYANVFFRPQIEAMYQDIEYPICTDFSHIEQFSAPPDAQYVMAIDWALKRDATVILVARVDKNRWENSRNPLGEVINHGDACPIVFCQGFTVKPTGERYSWQELKGLAVMIHKHYNDAACLFDATGMAGEMINDDLQTLGMTGHEGYDFAGNEGNAKTQLILVAQQALQSRSFVFPLNEQTNNLVEQLLIYDRNDKNLQTDFVFAFCILAERLRRANLPISQVLSLPLVYAHGTRQFGAANPFDYLLSNRPRRPNLLTDSGIVLSNTGYKEIVA